MFPPLVLFSSAAPSDGKEVAAHRVLVGGHQSNKRGGETMVCTATSRGLVEVCIDLGGGWTSQDSEVAMSLTESGGIQDLDTQ